MASIPRDTSDIGYRLRALESRAGVLERATGLNSASIGAGGLRVRDGGEILITDGGGLTVRRPGSIAWTYDGVQDGMYWGTLYPATDYDHGLLLMGPDGTVRMWLARDSNGDYEAAFGTDETPVTWFTADAHDVQLRASNDAIIDGRRQLFFTSGTGPSVLDSDGQVQVGMDASEVFTTTDVITNAPANVYISGSGQLGRTSWTPTSSVRYKQDIEPYRPDPAVVDLLAPVTYRLKADVAAGGVYPVDVEPPSVAPQRPGQPQAPEPEPVGKVPAPSYVGFTAEGLDEVGLGEFVVYDSQGRPEQVQYDRLVAVLVPAVQDLRARVAELEERCCDG